MQTKITDGRYLAQKTLNNLASQINLIKSKIFKQPYLAIILVGEDPASKIYVRNKLKAANEIGIKAEAITLDNNCSTKEIFNIIDKLNEDSTISGIIVQLPLPSHINKDEVMQHINPLKDVDGFNPLNIGYLHAGLNKGFIPSTALGCVNLIKHQVYDLTSMSAVILSRSQIVGKPLSALLLRENVTVTICHSKTQNLINYTKNADIVITAIGKANFLTAEYFNSDAIIIDVGISKIAGTNSITGDVDYTNVFDKVKYLSPVPGGVGPLTVAYLLANTFKAFIQHNQLENF